MRTLTRLAAVCVFMSFALALSVFAQEDRASDDRAQFAVSVEPPAPDPLPDPLHDPLHDGGPSGEPSGEPGDVVPTRPTEPAGDQGEPDGDQQGRDRHRRVTVLMSGDLLWHDTVWASAHEDAVRRGERQRFDFDPMFAAMKPFARYVITPVSAATPASAMNPMATATLML